MSTFENFRKLVCIILSIAASRLFWRLFLRVKIHSGKIYAWPTTPQRYTLREVSRLLQNNAIISTWVRQIFVELLQNIDVWGQFWINALDVTTPCQPLIQVYTKEFRRVDLCDLSVIRIVFWTTIVSQSLKSLKQTRMKVVWSENVLIGNTLVVTLELAFINVPITHSSPTLEILRLSTAFNDQKNLEIPIIKGLAYKEI